MARHSTGARFRLGEPLDSDLADFCAANWDSSATSVIREAVRAFIDARLSNPKSDLQERFDGARKKRLAQKKQGSSK